MILWVSTEIHLDVKFNIGTSSAADHLGGGDPFSLSPLDNDGGTPPRRGSELIPLG